MLLLSVHVTSVGPSLCCSRQRSLSQDERGVHETVSQDDDSDQPEEAVYVESKSDGNAASKKRKASKKLKSPRFVSSHFLIVSTRPFHHL